jgi:hypothetical protein
MDLAYFQFGITMLYFNAVKILNLENFLHPHDVSVGYFLQYIIQNYGLMDIATIFALSK